MTETEFREAAKKVGMSDNEINCQIRLSAKLRSAGLPPITYEEALAAKRQGSCMKVFEASAARISA